MLVCASCQPRLCGKRQERDDRHELGPVWFFRIAKLSGAPLRQEVVAAHLHVVAGGLIVREVVDFQRGLKFRRARPKVF